MTDLKANTLPLSDCVVELLAFGSIYPILQKQNKEDLLLWVFRDYPFVDLDRLPFIMSEDSTMSLTPADVTPPEIEHVRPKKRVQRKPHVMTPKRVAAFQKAQEARRAKLAVAKATREQLIKQSESESQTSRKTLRKRKAVVVPPASETSA